MSSLGFNPYTTLTQARTTALDGAANAAKPDAGQAIANGIGDFRAALQKAEETAIQTAVSGADPHAMVQALSNAELMLDAVVTIRDKVVEAYQELLRMPV
ncbi:MAG: flagellar hook-basal body complex protein FliE [Hyphomonas sp.]|jgi:flagellar hook-basal body complex protein FliE